LLGMGEDWLKNRGVIERVERCPVCGSSSLVVRELEYEAPYLGRLFLCSAKCAKCGYSTRRTFTLEDRPPRRVEYLVEDEEDLKARVVRSESARVEIPELGAVIEPGPAAEAVITSVEGVLDRVREALESMVSWAETPEELEAGREALRRLEEALEGRRKVTLVIEDPRGLSAIVPPPGREGKLKIKELRHLQGV